MEQLADDGRPHHHEMDLATSLCSFSSLLSTFRPNPFCLVPPTSALSCLPLHTCYRETVLDL